MNQTRIDLERPQNMPEARAWMALLRRAVPAPWMATAAVGLAQSAYTPAGYARYLCRAALRETTRGEG